MMLSILFLGYKIFFALASLFILSYCIHTISTLLLFFLYNFTPASRGVVVAMAGGGGGGESRSFEFTPTWVVAVVSFVIVLISLVVERSLHKLGKVTSSQKKINKNKHIYINQFYMFFDSVVQEEESRFTI